MTLTLWGVQIWAATLVFGRVGAMVMLLPGFGEPAIPARVRLGFALALALAIAPNVAAQLPEPPSTAWGISGLIMGETMIGVMLGGAARILVSSLATAGQIFGLEIGLAFAQTADPTMTQSGQVMAVFMSLMGVALVFATGLDHMFLQGVAGTYDLIAPGATVPIGDSAQLALNAVTTSFRVGFQIAAPVVVAGLIFRLGLGALSRLIPQIQVFFVVLPLQVMGGFVVMALALSTGMLMWLDSLEQYATWVQG
jgi:flagellar biosynthetic protein FliR